MSDAAASSPRVWLLLADKRGDNAQVEALAPALGWPFERKNLTVRPEWTVAKPKVAASLDHLDLEASDALAPPWPDLILTIGRRPSMAALWVKRASGGHTKLVLLGKPSGHMTDFDLVIASAEVQLPPVPNAASIALPLMRIDEADVARAVAAWGPRLDALPRPLIGVLVGGPTGPFAFDAAATQRLLGLLRQIVQRGGTPYVTTSRRTPPDVIAALEAQRPPGTLWFRWTPDAEENPYRALLGAADGLVVTGDSISMLVEAVKLRRPVAILPLSTGPLGRLDEQRRRFSHWLFDVRGEGPWHGVRRALARAAFQRGLLTHTRDFTAFYELLFTSGLAARSFDELAPPTGEIPDDLEHAAAAVRALLAPHRSPAAR
ncbi:mitochondrial fission ELM1 family protein [Myxococcota bacterium]|nr:mitochondrial fission ELM1 family protein [Myxococcota bacterium]